MLECQSQTKNIGLTISNIQITRDGRIATGTLGMLQVSENHDEGKSSGDGSTSRQSASNRRGVVVVSDDAADLSEKKAGCCS